MHPVTHTVGQATKGGESHVRGQGEAHADHVPPENSQICSSTTMSAGGDDGACSDESQEQTNKKKMNSGGREGERQSGAAQSSAATGWILFVMYSFLSSSAKGEKRVMTRTRAGQSVVATHSPSLLSTVPPGQTQPTTQTWMQNRGGSLKFSHVRGQALAQELHVPPEDSQTSCSSGTGGEGDGTCNGRGAQSLFFFPSPPPSSSSSF